MTMVGVGIHHGLVDPYHHGEHQPRKKIFGFSKKTLIFFEKG